MLRSPDCVLVSAKLTTGVASQLSVAVNIAAAGIASQLTVTSAGAALNIGALVSCTVINCDLVVVLPDASFVDHVLVKI